MLDTSLLDPTLRDPPVTLRLGRHAAQEHPTLTSAPRVRYDVDTEAAAAQERTLATLVDSFLHYDFLAGTAAGLEMAATVTCADVSTIEMMADRHVFRAAAMPASRLSSTSRCAVLFRT